jgi:hypothetical protein
VLRAGAPILLAPNILAVAHWSRIMGDLLYAASPYLPWAQLLRCSFDVDIEQCPKCSGRIRLIQSVTEPTVARAILERLGFPTEAPKAARARDPTDGDEEASDERRRLSGEPGETGRDAPGVLLNGLKYVRSLTPQPDCAHKA